MISRDKIENILSKNLDDHSIKYYKIIDLNSFIKEYTDKAFSLYNNFLNIKKDLIVKNISLKETIILFEYAGFGDTIHTKLLIQHIQKKYKNIVWITLDLIKDLYKEHDDILIYSNGIHNILRTPQILITRVYSNILRDIFYLVFQEYDNKIDISNAIINSHIINGAIEFNQHYFNIFNCSRDFFIKHFIKHTEKKNFTNSKPLIAFEHCSKSFSYLTDIEKYKTIVLALKEKYDIVLLGNINDPYIEGCFLDYRGKSFYDIITLLKECKYFIGRNSANQQLTVFFPDLPVIEIDAITSKDVSFEACKYRSNISLVKTLKEILEIVK